MAEHTPEEISRIARAAGIELDERRAGTIAARLSAVLEELDMIPDDALDGVEPLATFIVEEDAHE